MSRSVLSVGGAAWLVMAACGFDSNALGEGGAQCIEGRSAACRCADGSQGVSVCDANGLMSACDCAPAGGASGASTGAGGGAAPDSIAGSGGSGATMDGGAPLPPDELPQGGSSAGGGGSSGGVGGGGGAGAADGGAFDAGEKQDAGVTPGGPYARCESNEQCDSTLVCAPPPFATGVGYCTSQCTSGSWRPGVACPPPPSGSVGVACGSFNGLCQLQSCLNLQCPDRMECFQEMVVSFPFPTTVFYCAYPASG